MKMLRNVMLTSVPLIAAGLVYTQLATASLSGLPVVAEPPVSESHSEVVAATDGSADVVDVKTWEETIRKSGRRR